METAAALEHEAPIDDTRRASWTTHPAAALVAGLVAAIGLLTQTFRHIWDPSILLQAAVLEELGEELTSPRNPMIQTIDTDPAYSPWALVWGAIGRVFGMDQLQTLTAAAIVNMLLIGAGSFFLIRSMSSRRSAPFWGVVLLSFAWGPQVWGVPRVLGLGSLGAVMPLPSVTALGLSLGALGIALRWSARPRRPLVAAIVVCLGVVCLTHLTTGVWLALGLAAIAIDQREQRGLGPWLAIGATSAWATMILITMWPWFDLFELTWVPPAADIQAKAFYTDVGTKLAPALLVFPALWARFSERRTDWVVLHIVFGLSVAGLAAIDARWSWGQMIPDAITIGLFGAAVGLARLTEGRPWYVPLGVLTLICSFSLPWFLDDGDRLVPGLLLGDEARRELADQSFDDEIEFLVEHLERTDTVATQTQQLDRLVAASGARPLQAGFATMPGNDQLARQKAGERLLAPGITTATLTSEAERFGVSHLLLEESTQPPTGLSVIRGPDGMQLIPLLDP